MPSDSKGRRSLAVGGRSSADRTDERERLLAAAMEVLHRSGWWGFKVESVLKLAGLSTRSFYRHFGKKTDLLFALLEIEYAAASARLRSHTESVDSPAEKVRAYISAVIDTAYVEELARPSSLFSTHWRELLPEYPDGIERCTAQMMAPLVEAITLGKATGEFDSEDPVDDARTIYLLVASVTADQATLHGATPRAEVENMLLPFIFRTIGMG